MDYKQELITTIHDFGCNLELLEEKMLDLSEQSSTAVVIPALYDELERPALTIIRDRLKQCAFIKTVIVCLYADTMAQYTRAVEFFESLPQPTLVIWENGKRVTKILENF